MRYLALATDYDGTLAHDGIVGDETLEALRRLRASGRKLIMVTGRILDDLHATFGHVDEFDLVVAENGALLYNPATRSERLLAEAPPERFAEMLAAAGVEPLSKGRCIVATFEPHQKEVLAAIAELGLELQIIFNKGAVMVLPAGVNKATGLAAALQELGLSEHNVVGIGDAENDHAFLKACECSVAVANALPSLKDRADITTRGDHGRGVVELVDALLADDLRSFAPSLARHDLVLGTREDGQEVRFPVYGSNLLVAGQSGGGKSTLVTAVMEKLAESCYQFCALDPEGDYRRFPGAVVLGDADHEPAEDEVLSVLEKPDRSVILNLIALPVDRRPDYFERLLPRLAELQTRLGRPHWIILDEAHHVAPSGRQLGEKNLPSELGSILMITLGPARLATGLVEKSHALIAVGEKAGETIREFARLTGAEEPTEDSGDVPKGEAVLWWRDQPQELARFRVAPSHTERTRHNRKYAEAELTPDRSFYFRGPEGKLNLRAQNLISFVQMMEGVDDDTLIHHLSHGDVSDWFRNNIKDDDLADEAQRIESDGLPPAKSREELKRIIDERYALA